MKLLIFDGNSILNRAYYGIRPLTTSSGFNTNAIYGFLNILYKHMQDEGACKICVAFDLKAKTYRHLLYPDYKAGRKPMPQELYEQMPVLKQILDAMGIPRVEKEGLEADDLIGILSNQCTQNNTPCVIVTGDRDSFQLIDDNVTVKLAVTKSGTSSDEVYTPDKIYEKYGLSPKQLIDLKALMGDNSDRIPGVPGIGEKTAITLLKKYGTLENVFLHAEEEKGALKEKLLHGKDSAFLSRELGRIVRDQDIDLKAEDIPEPHFDKQELLNLFTQLEMSSMVKKFELDQTSTIQKQEQLITEGTYRDEIFEQPTLYVLHEQDQLYIKDKNQVVCVPCSDEILKKLSSCKIVTHNAKPLLHAMNRAQLPIQLEYDTMLAAYLINPSQSSYPLPMLAQEYAEGHSAQQPEHLVIYLDLIQKNTEQKLQQDGQEDLYRKIELPLCRVLADMEYCGFAMDRNFLESFGEMLTETIGQLSDEIFRQAGQEFNINSPKQLGEILFEHLGMPATKKTKTGYSTGKEVLEKLKWKTQNPIIDNILDYRMLTKLKSTYVDAFLSKLDQTNRIHTSFTQTVTQTGRISSIEPNLQNIPVRTDLGRQLRKAFIAKEGYVLIDADYSQIELRVLAHIANDSRMQQAFIEEKDIHTITASQVFQMPEPMVTPELRRRAKAVNFGIVYGIGDYSLSQDIGVSVKEARQYIENYLETYSGVREYMKNIVAFADQNGYIQTLFGRRRYVPDIHAKNKQLQAFAQRVCMNTPIQGTAADLIKLAMVRVDDQLRQSGLDARLILQVHDELIIEAKQEQAQQAAAILKQQMEHAADLSVPLVVDIGVGNTWFDAKK